MIESFSNTVIRFLSQYNVSKLTAESLSDFVVLIVAVILAFILDQIIQKIGNKIITKTSHKTKSQWDDILLANKFFKRLLHLIPTFLFMSISDKLFTHAIHFNNIISGFVQIYLVIIMILIINSFLKSMNDIYLTYEGSKSRPIKGYIQTIQIIIISFAVVIIFSVLLGRSPLVILGGLGAFAAILMLIFKDTILGFVAGIQISFNDMVRLGDWITMTKYGTDGVVVDIALTTVKIQNWDKTISTIPAYSLVSDSFQNWRGMEESGGRRIKRSIFIDINTIKFCNQEMLDRFSKIHLIKDYIKETEEKLNKINEENGGEDSVEANSQRQTNIGIFRAYMNAYLQSNTNLHDHMTFVVRQLQLTEKGLPLEIYVFSKVKEWAAYEALQADIFDHILSVVSEFDLSIFQNPSGNDFKEKFKLN